METNMILTSTNRTYNRLCLGIFGNIKSAANCHGAPVSLRYTTPSANERRSYSLPGLPKVQSLRFREKRIVVVTTLCQWISGLISRKCRWNASDFGIKDHLEWWRTSTTRTNQMYSKSKQFLLAQNQTSIILCWVASLVWWFDTCAMLPLRASSMSNTNRFLHKGVSTLALCGIARYYL